MLNRGELQSNLTAEIQHHTVTSTIATNSDIGELGNLGQLMRMVWKYFEEEIREALLATQESLAGNRQTGKLIIQRRKGSDTVT